MGNSPSLEETNETLRFGALDSLDSAKQQTLTLPHSTAALQAEPNVASNDRFAQSAPKSLSSITTTRTDSNVASNDRFAQSAPKSLSSITTTRTDSNVASNDRF